MKCAVIWVNVLCMQWKHSAAWKFLVGNCCAKFKLCSHIEYCAVFEIPRVREISECIWEWVLWERHTDSFNWSHAQSQPEAICCPGLLSVSSSVDSSIGIWNCSHFYSSTLVTAWLLDKILFLATSVVNLKYTNLRSNFLLDLSVCGRWVLGVSVI